MTNEKDREIADRIIDIWYVVGSKTQIERKSDVADEIARIRSEAVKAERERIEAIVTEEILEYDCEFTGLVNSIVSRILSPNQGTDEKEYDVCTWIFGGYLWSASCGATWEFPEGSPEDNEFRYCPHCGKPVKEEGRG